MTVLVAASVFHQCSFLALMVTFSLIGFKLLQSLILMLSW